MTFRVQHLPFGWFWEMVFSNGKVVATSDRFYTSERGAIAAARRVAHVCATTPWHIESPNESSTGWGL